MIEKRTVKSLQKRIAALNKPVIVVLFVCLVLVSLNIFVAERNRAFDSDDVSWQTTLMSWRPFSGQQAYVGAKDNFIVNLPFIAVADSLVGAGSTQLLLASLMMAVVNFALFYVASLYFLKKANVKLEYKSLFPFIWLASFGFGLSSLFLNTVWRDYEIGLSFVYYALAAMYYFDDINPFKRTSYKLLSLSFVFICGLFVLSDPYFFYFTVAPIVSFFVIQYLFKKVPRRKLMVVLSWSLSTWVISKLLTEFIAKAGIIEPSGNLTFPGLSKIGSASGQLVGSAGSIFGAGFSWLSIANLFILLMIVGLVLRELRPKRFISRLKNSASNVWMAFFSGLALLIAVASFAVDEGGIYTYRYLILAVYIFILILSLNTRVYKNWLRTIVIGGLLIATVSNMFSSYNSYKLSAETVSPNAGNLQIVAAVRRLGISKGYAGYWEGNINTYYAHNINFLPITCDNDKTVPLRFLVNGALFTKPSQKTFILLDPDMDPPICSLSEMVSQFGQPAQEVKVSDTSILVYDYDVVSKMPR